MSLFAPLRFYTAMRLLPTNTRLRGAYITAGVACPFAL